MSAPFDLFASLCPRPKIFANWMGWFTNQNDKHVHKYQSDDIRTVQNQVRLAKYIGINGFVVNWYGYNPDYAEPTNAATLMLKTIAEYEAFEFSIMLDSGLIKWIPDESARPGILQDALNYALDTFVESPAYTKHPNGKPLFWEFDLKLAGIDLPAFIASNPDVPLLCKDAAPMGSGGSYAWVNGFPDGVSYTKNYLANLPSENLNVPCMFFGFDDHDPDNPSDSIWGGPARKIDYRDGRVWAENFAAIKASHATENFPFIQVCTWNDYDERTSIEPLAISQTGLALY